MRKTIVALMAALMLSGCGNFSQSLDSEIVSSMKYDGVDCKTLIADRKALAARYDIPAKGGKTKPGQRPAYLVPGFGTMLPDVRGKQEKERRQALGELDAMDRSLERRRCVTA